MAAVSVRETSRDYQRPHRPLPLRLFNALGRGRATHFDIDELIAAARRKAKLERFDNEDFRAPLGELVASLEHEARLSATGRFMTRAHFEAGLINNLRVHHWLEREPAILAAPLARPILVCGLARSGTTLVQRMLAELPGARPVLTWEAFEPAPEPGWTRGGPDGRVARSRRAEGFLRWLSPDLFAVHPMDHSAPEEDVIILEQLFMSGVPESTYNVPSYAAWLERQDQTPVYRWLERCLKLLQWQRSGDFWVLKSPHHLEWLDTVFAVFPEATVIQTHRDPVETVPSFCSLVAHGWGVMSDHVDPREVGRQWSRKIERMLGRALATRDARDGAGFIDVRYPDLIADPLAVMEQLCAQLDLPWSPEIRTHLGEWLTRNRQHRHGVHRYDASDFGLTAADLSERYADYRRRFDVG